MGPLPPPINGTEQYLAAVLDRLGEILDRLPGPAQPQQVVIDIPAGADRDAAAAAIRDAVRRKAADGPRELREPVAPPAPAPGPQPKQVEITEPERPPTPEPDEAGPGTDERPAPPAPKPATAKAKTGARKTTTTRKTAAKKAPAAKKTTKET